MYVKWELRPEPNSFAVFEIGIETDHIRGGRDFFGMKMDLGLNISSNHQIDHSHLLMLGGELYWSSDQDHIRNSAVIPLQPLFTNRHNIIIPFTQEMIRRIEEGRKGKKPELYLVLYGLCQIPDNIMDLLDPQTAAHSNYVLQRIKGNTVNLNGGRYQLALSREKWAEILKEMGYTSFRLIEVPEIYLSKKQDERWSKVTQRFENMLNKQRFGDYEECIEEARHLVDELARVLAGNWKLNLGDLTMAGQMVESLESRLKNNKDIVEKHNQPHTESLFRTLYAIVSISNAYHHSGPSPTLIGNLRQQAEYTVLLATAAVSAVSRMLDNNKTD